MSGNTYSTSNGISGSNTGSISIGGSISPNMHTSTTTTVVSATAEDNINIDPRALAALQNYNDQLNKKAAPAMPMNVILMMIWIKKSISKKLS